MSDDEQTQVQEIAEKSVNMLRRLHDVIVNHTQPFEGYGNPDGSKQVVERELVASRALIKWICQQPVTWRPKEEA